MPNSKLHWQQPHLGSLHNGKTHAQSVTACTSCITKEANFTIHALVAIDLFIAQDMTGHAAAFMCWSSWCCQLNVLIPHVSNAAKLANAWPCQNLWNRRRTSHLQDHVVRNPNKHAALNFLSSSFAEICLFEGNVDFEREKCCHFEANPLKAHARLLNVAHKLFLNALTNLTTSLSCVLSTVAMWGPNHSSLLCFLLQLDSKEGSLLLRLWLNVCCFDFVFFAVKGWLLPFAFDTLLFCLAKAGWSEHHDWRSNVTVLHVFQWAWWPLWIHAVDKMLSHLLSWAMTIFWQFFWHWMSCWRTSQICFVIAFARWFLCDSKSASLLCGSKSVSLCHERGTKKINSHLFQSNRSPSNLCWRICFKSVTLCCLLSSWCCGFKVPCKRFSVEKCCTQWIKRHCCTVLPVAVANSTAKSVLCNCKGSKRTHVMFPCCWGARTLMDTTAFQVDAQETLVRSQRSLIEEDPCVHDQSLIFIDFMVFYHFYAALRAWHYRMSVFKPKYWVLASTIANVSYCSQDARTSFNPNRTARSADTSPSTHAPIRIVHTRRHLDICKFDWINHSRFWFHWLSRKTMRFGIAFPWQLSEEVLWKVSSDDCPQSLDQIEPPKYQ